MEWASARACRSPAVGMPLQPDRNRTSEKTKSSKLDPRPIKLHVFPILKGLSAPIPGAEDPRTAQPRPADPAIGSAARTFLSAAAPHHAKALAFLQNA